MSVVALETIHRVDTGKEALPVPLYLSNEDQQQSLTAGDAVDAMRGALKQFAKGDAIRRPRIDSLIPVNDSRYFNFSSMEGGIRNPGYYALRIKPDVFTFTTVGGKKRTETFTHRPGKYGGLVFLFNTENAELLAIMNDGFVQHMRVAATAALGVQHLSRPGSTVLGLIGSGWMARTFPLTIGSVRSIKQIRVFSPNSDHVRDYCDYMKDRVAVTVEPAKSAAEVAEGADILCCCTTSLEPVIEPDDLRAGTHLNYVRAWELSPEVCAKVDVEGVLLNRRPMSIAGYVDDDFAIRMHAMSYAAGTTEERDAIPRGLPNPARFPNARRVTCADWDSGESFGREHDDEISVLANQSYGTAEGDAGVSAGIQGVQFAAVAGRLYEKALAGGIGTELPLDMFLQDIPT